MDRKKNAPSTKLRTRAKQVKFKESVVQGNRFPLKSITKRASSARSFYIVIATEHYCFFSDKIKIKSLRRAE